MNKISMSVHEINEEVSLEKKSWWLGERHSILHLYRCNKVPTFWNQKNWLVEIIQFICKKLNWNLNYT